MIYLLFKKNIAKKENVIFIIFISSYFFLLIFTDKLIRYVLPIYPILIILFYKSMKFYFKIFNVNLKKGIIFITFITIILFSTSYYGKCNNQCGCVLEKNMEYLDSLKTQYMAINFIEDNYKNSTILAIWPMDAMITKSYLGYTGRDLKLKLFKKNESLSDFDIIVQTSQTSRRYGPQLSRFIDKGLLSTDLRLVKKFGIKNKYTEIYENIK